MINGFTVLYLEVKTVYIDIHLSSCGTLTFSLCKRTLLEGGKKLNYDVALEGVRLLLSSLNTTSFVKIIITYDPFSQTLGYFSYFTLFSDAKEPCAGSVASETVCTI